MDNNRSPRATLFNLSSFEILTMFRRGLFYSYMSIYLRFFLGLSVTETTFFATLPMVVNVVFQRFVWGMISDRLQRRKVFIIIGEILASFGTLAVWYCHKLPSSKAGAGYVIIIGMSLVEIFWSMSNIGWSAMISDIYPARERTGVYGKLSSLGAMGRIVGALLGGLAYDGLARYYDGWGFDQGFLFFVASGIMLASTVPMFFVPEGGARAHDRADGLAAQSNTGTPAQVSKIFTVFLIAMIFINFGRNSISVIVSQYLSLEQGFAVSSRLLSHIVNTQSLAMVIFGLLITRLSRRYKDIALLFAGTAAGAMSLVGYAAAWTLPLVFVSSFLCGISMVVIMSSSYSYASRLIPPEQRGRQFAWYNATFFLSWGAGGTLVTGPIVDLMLKAGASDVSAYRMSFLASALLVIAGALMLYAADRKKRAVLGH